MTKEAAITAMEQGGYKVAHRFFGEGEWIAGGHWKRTGQIGTSMKKAYRYQQTIFGLTAKVRNGKRDGE